MEREEYPQPGLACRLAVLEQAASAIYVALTFAVGVKKLAPPVTFPADYFTHSMPQV